MTEDQFITRPRVLVFDTGPLRELVAYHAVHTLGFAHLAHELSHLSNPPYYQAVTVFVSGFQRKTTTPHVVAELSGWVRKLDRRIASAIWTVVYDQFTSMRMDEGLVRLLEMPRQLVTEIGATDAGILKCALSFPRPLSIVLSIDQKLIAECRAAGLSAQDLWQVIAGEV